MGFQWIEADDAANSVYAWIGGADRRIPTWSWCATSRRWSDRDTRSACPPAGPWREALNTDAAIYGGQGRGNLGT
jgi:1,4-alpha-glucan branching enzyme